MALSVELGGCEFGHGDRIELYAYKAKIDAVAGKDGSIDILSLV